MSVSNVTVLTSVHTEGIGVNTLQLGSTNSTGLYRCDYISVTTASTFAGTDANTKFLFARAVSADPLGASGNTVSWSFGTAISGSSGGVAMKADGQILVIGYVGAANVAVSALESGSSVTIAVHTG